MSLNRLTRRQMLGLLLTAVLGALAVVIVMLSPRPHPCAEPVYRRPDSIAVQAPKRIRKTPARRSPTPPPAPRRHLDEPF